MLRAPQQKFCCKLLKLLALAKRALLLDEVHEALQLDYALDSASVGAGCQLLLDDTELELICGPMATVRNRSICLIHLTAHEHLKCDPADLKVDAELRKFFVDVGTGNARITGLCTKYLSTHCVARAKQAERVNTQEIRLKLPFIDYACHYWLLHIVESTPQALVQFSAELQSFLQSRSPFFWIEFVLESKHSSCSLLRFMLQSLLDWLPTNWIGMGTRVEDLYSLLCYWAKSYVRLLAEWEVLLQQMPYKVHDIDPSTIFASGDYGICNLLEQSMSFDKHVVFHEVDTFTKCTEEPPNRCLLTGSSQNQLAEFALDSNRGIIFAVQTYSWRMPQLRCQDAATGQRLAPIFDIGYSDVEAEVSCISVALSSDGHYCGIVCRWKEVGRSYVIYSAVWEVSATLDFGQNPARVPWAQKLLSTAKKYKMNYPPRITSDQMISFDATGYFNCPTGRIDMRSGSEKPWKFLVDNDGRIDEMRFSKNGKVAVFYDRDEGAIKMTSCDGVEKLIDSIAVEDQKTTKICCVSSTDRYIVFLSEETIIFYDMCSKKASRFPFPFGLFNDVTRFCFDDGDNLLLRSFQVIDEVGRRASKLYLWAVGGWSSVLTSPHMHLGVINNVRLDGASNMVHILSNGNIWSRLQIQSNRLLELDRPLIACQYDRVEHAFSLDGAQLAVMHFRRSR
jgi:hypothetical protein